jgi:predicted TIM-barrel fold metal-dependent hydrolase
MIIDVHVHARKGTRITRLQKACEPLDIGKVVYMGEPDFVLNAAKKAPDFVIPFAHLKLDEATPEDARRCIDQGIAGFKIICPTYNYDDERYFPFYEAVEKGRKPVLAHTGIVARRSHRARSRRSSARMRPIYLDTLCRAFPRINWIGAHLGNPWYEEAAETARWNRNLAFDLSGTTLVKMQPRLHRFGEVLWWEGAWKSVVFGSDCGVDYLPTAVDNYKRLLDALRLDEKTRQLIWHRNAARLLKVK